MCLRKFVLEVPVHICTADYFDHAIAAHTEEPNRHFPGRVTQGLGHFGNCLWAPFENVCDAIPHDHFVLSDIEHIPQSFCLSIAHAATDSLRLASIIAMIWSSLKPSISMASCAQIGTHAPSPLHEDSITIATSLSPHRTRSIAP